MNIEWYRVRSVIRSEGLEAIRPKRYVPRMTDSRHSKTVRPNLLKVLENWCLNASEAIVADRHVSCDDGRSFLLSGDVPGQADKADRGLTGQGSYAGIYRDRRLEDATQTWLHKTDRDHSHGPRFAVRIERI